MKQTITTFKSYEDFVRQFVMPLKNQGYDRLDGETSGSSRRVAAQLRHDDDLFIVDEESRIISLIRPFEYANQVGIDVAAALLLVPTRTRKDEMATRVTRWKLLPIPEAGPVTRFYVYLVNNRRD